MRARTASAGSRTGSGFIATSLDANADFIAFALMPGGPLAFLASALTPEKVASCMRSMLVFAVNLFARDALAGNDSELIALVAYVANIDSVRVMLLRDQLRKQPRSEEWMLILWLARDLGADAPKYDPRLEREFGYNYLAYMGQFRAGIESMIARDARA
jgi:hypothetical protein